MSESPSKSKSGEESQDELLKYSTGSASGGDDTVVRVASHIVPENLSDSQPPAGAPVPVTEEHESAPVTPGEDLTPSEVRYRLFPLESGHPAGTPLPETTGLHLDHFRLEERIGTGGMGAVFRATDERLDRVVAIKVLSPSQLHQPDAISRFKNEARSAARLDHENIARVFTFSKDKGVHFIVYEYVTGPNVRDIIQKQGRIDIGVAVKYTIQIARALNHTSAAGVVHRDIKPSNIIITPEGLAKLVDLGLARSESTESTDDLTVAGTTLGTFDYIAPEQAKDPRNVDVRSDIYALGCTLYHMLTGLPPYPEGTVLQKLLDHQAQETPDPVGINPLVPPTLSLVVKKMMASNPLERYFTPDSLIRDLIEVAASLGIQSRNPQVLGIPRATTVRKFAWESYIGWILAGFILLGVIIGLDYFSSQPGLSTIPVAPPSREVPDSPPDSLAENEPPAEDTKNASEETVENSDNNLSGIAPPLTNKLNNMIVAPLTGTSVENKKAKEPGAKPRVTSFRIKSKESGSVTEYPSLDAACRAAETGDVIEILQAGTEPITTTLPVLIEQKSLIIRGAGQSESRPLLKFELPQPASDFYTALFTIQNGGTLNLINLDLHLNVSEAFSDSEFIANENYSPALFALSGPAGSLKLQGVSVTLHCTGYQSATVFQLLDTNNLTTAPSAAQNKLHQDIKLDDSFIRSDSHIFEVNHLYPARLHIENSVLASRDSVLQVNGNPDNSTADSVIQVDLNHTSIQSDQSFISIVNDVYEPRNFPRLVIEPEYNIFSARNSAFNFLEYLDFSQSQELSDLLTWEGSNNFFHNINYYRKVQPNDGELEIDNSFELWQMYWKYHPPSTSFSSEVENVWLTSTSTQPYSELTLEDFKLRTGTDNPAVQGSSDGQTDAGAPIRNLEQLGFQLRKDSETETPLSILEEE